ncbi:MAG: PAS domain S-box protein, partial [Dehalococcoidales bacterium]|nr:PAS domain S-box protein [Dehalococcoidales bacterium]
MSSSKGELSGKLSIDEEFEDIGFVSIFKDKYFWYIIILILILALLVYAPYTTQAVDNFVSETEVLYYIAFHRIVYIIAVALAAWRYGTKGGIITCIILIPIVFSIYILGLQQETSFLFLEAGVIILGIIISWFIGKNKSFQQLLEENSKILRIQTDALSQEIIERKRAEDETRKSEKWYRLLAENTTDVIWTVNIKSPEKLTYISPSVNRLIGYNVNEAMSKSMKEVFTPLSYQIAMAAIKQTLESINPAQKEPFKSLTLE